ncbi:MAG TPA: RDD family protein [Candidatus Limnocylindria bacterium]|nr:RDD family protein [Candidatus Limnocylindria bacterium]
MESTIAASGAVPAVPRYASWGRRVWASTLDAIFNFLLLIPVAILVGLVRSDFTNYSGLLLSLLYFTLGHGGASGQTWGKKLAGIRVVHESGAPLGYVRALIRWAVAIGLTILLIIPNLIDVLWPLWDSKKQALRDKAVGSIVVYA